MGLLDELKQQAEQKRDIVARAEADQEARYDVFRESIQPKMVQLFSYLSEIVEQLNFVDSSIRVSYPIKTYAALSELQQKDYKIRADSMEGMKKIDFSFECIGEGRVEFDVENKLYIDRLEEYLNSVRLTYVCNKYKDSRHNVTSARFRVDNHVPVSFQFVADIDAGTIRVEIRNYHNLHIDRFTVDPQSIDEAFLDQLGKFIVRQDSSVFQLEISDEERNQIRQRLNSTGADKSSKKKAAAAKRLTRKAAKKKSATAAKKKTSKKKKLNKEVAKIGLPDEQPTAGEQEAEISGSRSADMMERAAKLAAKRSQDSVEMKIAPVDRAAADSDFEIASDAPAESQPTVHDAAPKPQPEPQAGLKSEPESKLVPKSELKPELEPEPQQEPEPASATVKETVQDRDVDDDLSEFELKFSALPAAYKPYESLGDSGQSLIQRLSDLEPFPEQLLKEAGQTLEELNKTTLDVEERIALATAIFGLIYPVLNEIYHERAKVYAPKENQVEEGLLESAIEVVDEVATAYKHAFTSMYSVSRSRFESVASELKVWAFRVLELIRLEQRLRALRYQKLPRAAWLDCNQVFFSMLLHNAIDDKFNMMTLIGVVDSKEKAIQAGEQESTLRRVYLSVQLFGVLDVITWPASLFFFSDAYLEEQKNGLIIEQDSGEVLKPGCLVTFLRNDGPPLHKRSDAIPAPALRIDFSALLNKIVEEHETLANMMFLNNVDEGKLSPALASLGEQDRIPILEMILLALQRRERKHIRHSVFGTEKVLVHFGFATCFTNLSGFAKPDEDNFEKSAQNVELIQAKSIQLAESHPPFASVPWKILNFSTGGLLIATETGRFTSPLQVGQLTAFKPSDSLSSPLMGFIGRIQRPVDHQTEISVIRMAKHAEAALAQDHVAVRDETGKPVILMQDFEGRWQVISLHEYGYTTGTPLKLIRANGVRILLRLGDIWMTKRDFTVFEARSASL